MHEIDDKNLVGVPIIGVFAIGSIYAIFYWDRTQNDLTIYIYTTVLKILRVCVVAHNMAVAMLFDGKRGSYWRKFKIMVVKEFTTI
jgi:hypothetical protein